MLVGIIYLVFSCVTMQLKVIIRDSYGGPGISPQSPNLPPNFFKNNFYSVPNTRFQDM